jgi:two-component system, NarL family, nitrate/nitrite response regulator NarL
VGGEERSERAWMAQPPSPRAQVRPLAVLVVSDHGILRDGLARGVLTHVGALSVRVAADASQALRLIRSLALDIVVLDVTMPHAAECARAIGMTVPGLSVLGCCAPADADTTSWCSAAGVTRCVSRHASLGELWSSVEAMLRDRPRLLVPRRATGSGDEKANPAAARPALTPREAQIVTLLDQGCSNKEIAARLAIAVGTVKQHVHNILSKLHADRRGVAAARMRGRV